MDHDFDGEEVFLVKIPGNPIISTGIEKAAKDLMQFLAKRLMKKYPFDVARRNPLARIYCDVEYSGKVTVTYSVEDSDGEYLAGLTFTPVTSTSFEIRADYNRGKVESVSEIEYTRSKQELEESGEIEKILISAGDKLFAGM